MPKKIEGGYIFLIDKDLRWTSFDVVNKIRYAMREKKVGHAGTLDPLATGLVVVCTGKGTKQIESFMASEKEYTGTFFLGATTPSFDAETEPDATFSISHITQELAESTAQTFVGKQMQVPPIFSAIKVDGKKLYELARKGKSAKLEPRPIEIFEFEITGYRLPYLDFRVLVSKGTYIRSLAFDFGKALNSGAYLSSLRRTKIGNQLVQDALTIPQWLEWWDTEKQLIALESSQPPT